MIETLRSVTRTSSYCHRLRHKMNTVSAIRELIADETLRVVVVSTQRQLADVGTKALGRNVFCSLCAMIYTGWRKMLGREEDARTPGLIFK